ncbi:hypothetical protein U1Q18_015510 [Sarracenia purpurea var. burkii]
MNHHFRASAAFPECCNLHCRQPSYGELQATFSNPADGAATIDPALRRSPIFYKALAAKLDPPFSAPPLHRNPSIHRIGLCNHLCNHRSILAHRVTTINPTDRNHASAAKTRSPFSTLLFTKTQGSTAQPYVAI